MTIHQNHPVLIERLIIFWSLVWNGVLKRTGIGFAYLRCSRLDSIISSEPPCASTLHLGWFITFYVWMFVFCIHFGYHFMANSELPFCVPHVSLVWLHTPSLSLAGSTVSPEAPPAVPSSGIRPFCRSFFRLPASSSSKERTLPVARVSIIFCRWANEIIVASWFKVLFIEIVGFFKIQCAPTQLHVRLKPIVCKHD